MYIYFYIYIYVDDIYLSQISFTAKAEGPMIKTTYFPPEKSYPWVPARDCLLQAASMALPSLRCKTLSHSRGPEQD